ncbi:oligoendopeptidase F [Bacillus sp. ISL-47]|uniref:oligoendopeptidase F n=1 Tax=Bacillus sp. ISL-47 TaxID=2819130 RepID=UPI001BE6B259|nr:oligoendopeptidase F [Bacillus sp. ISL-47]MBT2689495.1 oligoendopeptidase F [Bacillus sp. ISL-47]MBT2708313.1 oligoendopeptidase F [Pseudomonas sp. ISL-84]
MVQTVVTRLKRSEVPKDLTWKLEDLFASEEDWQKEMNSIEEDLAIFEQFKGKLHAGPQVFKNCLSAQERLSVRLVQAGTYAMLRQSEDGTNPDNQANSSKLASLRAKAASSLSFIESEILSLPDGTVENYIAEDSELEVYKSQLSDLMKTKEHRLSPETEEAIAALGEVLGAPYNVYQAGKLADMPFSSFNDSEGNELPNSFALYEDRYEFSPDTTIRRNAYSSFTDSLENYKNTFASAYSAEVKKQVTLSKLRKYNSVTQMLLDSQHVTEEMYHNQLDIIQKELAPHMRRFAQLKKKVLGLDKMLFCDLKAPLDPDFNPETTYEDASKVILEALKVMGSEYSEIMEKGLTERWVDLADNVGKSTGAFCSSPYGSHPFILITWTDTMRGAFVLAHELGHAGHFYLANKYQRIMNTRPSTYFVEAPSTLNELLLGQHLMEGTEDKRMKRWVILQLLGTYYHNFVTHLLEGEYQRRIYNLAEHGVPLTAKTLSDQKYETLSSFWGNSVELDEKAALTWMRQPHYYMGLYPYTYSAGLTASTAMAQSIKEEGQPAVDRWLDVLKSGGTKKPLELLRSAGIDMSKPDAIRKAVSYVGALVDELENSYE